MKLEIFASCPLAASTLPALATDLTDRTDTQSLIKAQCDGCHGKESPALADLLLDPEKYKKEKTGPRPSTCGDLIQPIGETDAERGTNLQRLKAGVGEGTWNLTRWAQRGKVPGTTREQMGSLQLKYGFSAARRAACAPPSRPSSAPAVRCARPPAGRRVPC